jgi:hypothetical protein
VEIGAEEGRAMLAKKDYGGGDEENREDEIDTEVFGMGHWLIGFYMRGEEERKLLDEVGRSDFGIQLSSGENGARGRAKPEVKTRTQTWRTWVAHRIQSGGILLRRPRMSQRVGNAAKDTMIAKSSSVASW